MIGMDRGSTIRTSTCQSFAPSSEADSCRDSGMPIKKVRMTIML